MCLIIDINRLKNVLLDDIIVGLNMTKGLSDWEESLRNMSLLSAV